MTATADKSRRIRVLIADGHRQMRLELRRLLDSEPDIEVIGEAASGEEALEKAVQLLPDVLLADIVMQAPDGLEITRRLRSALPSIRTLVMSPDSDACLAQEAFRAGSAGCIVKPSAVEELAPAIRLVAAGGTYLPGQRSGGQA